MDYGSAIMISITAGAALLDHPRQLARRTAVRMLAGWPLVLSARTGLAASPAEGHQAQVLVGAEFVDAQGGRHRMAELTRPLLLINLWAAWCPGCLTELPTIRRFNAEISPDMVDVVLLSHAMNWRGDMAFAREKKLPFRHWRLSERSAALTAAAFRVEADRFGLPQSLVFAGRDRALVQSYEGSMDWSAPQQLRLARAWLAAAR